MEKREPCTLLVGMPVSAPLWRRVWRAPKNTKRRVTIQPSNSTPGYFSEGNENTNSKPRCPSMFTAALSPIAKIWKQLKCPSADDERRCGVCMMEYYSAIKNEILPFETTWMAAEGIRLNEMRQRQTLYVITYLWNLKNETNK